MQKPTVNAPDFTPLGYVCLDLHHDINSNALNSCGPAITWRIHCRPGSRTLHHASLSRRSGWNIGMKVQKERYIDNLFSRREEGP